MKELEKSKKIDVTRVSRNHDEVKRKVGVVVQRCGH